MILKEVPCHQNLIVQYVENPSMDQNHIAVTWLVEHIKKRKKPKGLGRVFIINKDHI